MSSHLKQGLCVGLVSYPKQELWGVCVGLDSNGLTAVLYTITVKRPSN